MNGGRLVAVVGPSGAGKDSVMERLSALRPDIRLVRRVITRPSDAGGEDFESVSPAEFSRRKAAGEFAFDWGAHDLLYGIPKDQINNIGPGETVLFNGSRGIVEAARKVVPGLQVLLITAQDHVLAERLAARGREDSAAIRRRLGRADFAVPAGENILRIDNSGPLD